MQVRLGNWIGGNPSNAAGTIEWAGGISDMSKGPFNMYVQSVSIKTSNPAAAYEYGDMSGSYQSIKLLSSIPGSSSSSAAASSSAVPSSQPSGPVTISPKGLCGASSTFTCTGSSFGSCCSQYNYCGSSDVYCGTGCQSAFGTCGSAQSAGQSAAASVPSASASAQAQKPAQSATVQAPPPPKGKAKPAAGGSQPQQPQPQAPKTNPKYQPVYSGSWPMQSNDDQQEQHSGLDAVKQTLCYPLLASWLPFLCRIDLIS